MRAGLLQLLGWVVLLGALSWYVVARPPGAPGGEAESILTYPVRGELHFALGAQDRVVETLAWLAHPSPGPDTPAQDWAWRMEAVLTSREGRELWRQAWWLAAPDAEARAVWSDASPDRLTEGRVARLQLPDRGAGARLAVRALDVPPGARVLLVAHREVDRSPVGRLRLLLGDPTAFHAREAAAVGVPAWEDLPASWRRARVAAEQERLSALPAGGGLVPTERIFRRIPPSAPAEAPGGFVVAPGEALVSNVVGPGTWTVRWQTLAGEPVPAPSGSTRVVYADGGVEVGSIVPGRQGSDPLTIEGLTSIQVLRDAEGPVLQAFVETSARPWGPPTTPDLRQLELYRTTPDDDGLRWRATGEDLRITLRAALPAGARLRGGLAGPDGAAPEGTAWVEALDETGASLGRWPHPFGTQASPFDRPVFPEGHLVAATAEPVTTVLTPPRGTAWVTVRADRPCDVGVRAWDPVPLPPGGARVRPPAYDAGPELLATVRYVASEPEPWVARAPEDYEALAAAWRVVRIDAPVRLEPSDDGPSAERRWSSLPLRGRRAVIAEPGRDAGAPHTRVADRAARVQVEADGRLRVDYRVDPAEVGRTVRFSGESWAEDHVLASTGATLTLRPPRGEVGLTVDGPGLFLARSWGAPAWRTASVARLARSAPVEVPVPDGLQAVAVHVYQPPGSAGNLTWTLEPTDPAGLRPERRRWEGARPLGGAGEAWPMSFRGRLVARDPVVVRVEGAKTLRIGLEGAREAWIRLTATTEAPP